MSASRIGSSSFDLIGVRTGVEMEHDPINIDGFFILEETMAGAITLVKIKGTTLG